jgi:hypothetical protein
VAHFPASRQDGRTGAQVARWLKKIREPFLFGLDPEATPEFLGARCGRPSLAAASSFRRASFHCRRRPNAEVLERVRGFTAFDAANDLYHDFGRFDLAGVSYVFEVDCYARHIHGSKDTVGTGKLTIRRADEY